MTIFIAAILGGILGYTSHIRQSIKSRLWGVLEGFVVVSAANWMFYNFGWFWWLSLLLAIVVYALYLIFLQALLRTRVSVETTA